LIESAIKFTETGGQVMIKAEKNVIPATEFENENHVLITVSDTGIGIPEERLSGLFDLTEQSRNRNGTDNEKGSGLGLIISKDFVERHGGKIWAESEVGKGTEMKISLPIGQKEEE
jgi:signal transduction histidine kinase